jgi:3-oxoacyl-[acyl-carrier protein] reductase
LPLRRTRPGATRPTRRRKGRLLSLTKGFARDYGKENIPAYAVAPGWVATDVSVHISPDDPLLAGLPLGEVTTPQDVAEVITFLASGRSRHTTGATIDISGADYVRRGRNTT